MVVVVVVVTVVVVCGGVWWCVVVCKRREGREEEEGGGGFQQLKTRVWCNQLGAEPPEHCKKVFMSSELTHLLVNLQRRESAKSHCLNGNPYTEASRPQMPP